MVASVELGWWLYGAMVRWVLELGRWNVEQGGYENICPLIKGYAITEYKDVKIILMRSYFEQIEVLASLFKL